jgi:hypothetical protein
MRLPSPLLAPLTSEVTWSCFIRVCSCVVRRHGLTLPSRVGAVHSDRIPHELHHLIIRQALRLQFGVDVREGGHEWARAPVIAQAKPVGARKTVGVTTFVRQRDQLIGWADVQSVTRQQREKLVVRGVGMSDACRQQRSRTDRDKRTDRSPCHI